MPFSLRVTVKPEPDGNDKFDALDQWEDRAEPDEALHAYELFGEVGWCHMNFGGFYAMASYRYILDQPDDATMRDNDAWAKWATERGARILGTLAMFDNLDEPKVDEVQKEGLAQLQALGFCVRCCQPFVRAYIKARIPGSKIEGWEKVCPGCMIKLIMEPGEKE